MRGHSITDNIKNVFVCFVLLIYNYLHSTTSTTIQLPGPRAERGSWRRKIQRTRKADPKRRRKKRIGKTGKESVVLSLLNVSCSEVRQCSC